MENNEKRSQVFTSSAFRFITEPEKTGILLINTGSPDSPEVPDVRAYLKQFLSDPRVIDIHPFARWLLVNLIILPTRPKASAAAYKSIWTDRGSPLLSNSADFRDALRKEIPDTAIEIGMAYGKPSVPAQMDALIAQGVTRLVIAPMFPQYASATVGSVLELVYKTAAHKQNVPAITVLPPFYEEPEFLDAWKNVAQPELDRFKPDHVVISFHGLPERRAATASTASPRSSTPSRWRAASPRGCRFRSASRHPSRPTAPAWPTCPTASGRRPGSATAAARRRPFGSRPSGTRRSRRCPATTPTTAARSGSGTPSTSSPTATAR